MTSPCVLRAYPRTSAEQLGLLPLVVLGRSEIHAQLLDTSQSCTAVDDGAGTQDVAFFASPLAAFAATSSLVDDEFLRLSVSVVASASASAPVPVCAPAADRDLESDTPHVATSSPVVVSRGSVPWLTGYSQLLSLSIQCAPRLQGCSEGDYRTKEREKWSTTRSIKTGNTSETDVAVEEVDVELSMSRSFQTWRRSMDLSSPMAGFPRRASAGPA